MADWDSPPIWDKQGIGTPTDWLPVAADLVQALEDWVYEYSNRSPFEQDSKFDERQHAAKGLELARQVKRQLPDWTVIFHDDRIGTKYAVII
jgi:hypothetical protein